MLKLWRYSFILKISRPGSSYNYANEHIDIKNKQEPESAQLSPSSPTI